MFSDSDIEDLGFFDVEGILFIGDVPETSKFACHACTEEYISHSGLIAIDAEESIQQKLPIVAKKTSKKKKHVAKVTPLKKSRASASHRLLNGNLLDQVVCGQMLKGKFKQTPCGVLRVNDSSSEDEYDY